MKALKSIAQLSSLVFSPPTWILYFLVASSRNGLFFGGRTSDATIAILFFIPLIYFLYLFKTKRISDLDITIREERYRSLIVMNVSLFLLLIYLWIYHLEGFFYLTRIFFIIHAVISLITIKYKISFHMSYTIVFATFINFLYGYHLPFLFLTIPLIFWSRIYLKKHTPYQVLLAAIVTSTILFLFLH